MIGDRILTRPHNGTSSSDIRTLADIPSTIIDDAMGRLYAMSPHIKPLNHHTMCGPALTVRVPAGDNLYVHVALDMVAAGDILVVQTDPYTSRATLGELMLRYLAKKSISGVIIDGYVRDIDYIIKDCPFAVYARGISPNGPYKNGPGEINTTVSCGEQPVDPGTIIKGDEDGLVAINPRDLPECTDRSLDIASKEERTLLDIDKDGLFDRPWLKTFLDERAIELGEAK